MEIIQYLKIRVSYLIGTTTPAPTTSMPPTTPPPTPRSTTTAVTTPTTTACVTVDGMNNAESPIVASDVIFSAKYENGSVVDLQVPELGDVFTVEKGVNQVIITVDVDNGTPIDVAKLTNSNNIQSYDVSVKKARDGQEEPLGTKVNIYSFNKKANHLLFKLYVFEYK